MSYHKVLLDLVEKHSPRYGETVIHDGKKYRFMGIMDGEDDYYFVLYDPAKQKYMFASCVGPLDDVDVARWMM